MRYNLNEEEIKITVGLLINEYEISTNFLNELYGRNIKDVTQVILNELNYNNLDKAELCKIYVIREGINLFSGSTDEKRELRKKILEKIPDDKIVELYNKYPEKDSKKKSASSMRRPLSIKKWCSGKTWAREFVAVAGFPIILAGIGNSKGDKKLSIEVIEPKKTVPKLVEYQIDIKDKLLTVLKQEGNKTRCMISLPTGAGKIRVAVEAFLDWMQSSFEEEKYLLWIAQSEELCEQCISCVEQMWRSREFILPLKIYRYYSTHSFNLDDLEGGVVVASINKIHSRIKSKDPIMTNILSNTGAMIIDEAHRASTEMYDILFEEAKHLTKDKLFPVCGLSATPGRNTFIVNNQVDKLVERFQMNLITPEFGNDSKYVENPLEYFKEHKYLSKVNHIVFKSNIEYQLTEKELEDLKGKDEYSPSVLKTIANDTNRNTKIIKRLLKIKKGSSTLVYACTVDHAKFLATVFNIMGRKSAFVDSSTNKMERRIIIKQFTEGSIEFLFNYGVLTTGFDAPKTTTIVICRPVNSNILYEQIVGRGIRGIRFGGTEECDVIDFSDNIYNLGEQQAFMRFKHYWDKEADE